MDREHGEPDRVDTALVINNLLSAPVLAFVLAVGLTLGRFDVRLPEALPPTLAAYLLFAIGLKGGRSLGASTPSELLGPLAAALVIGAVTPVIAFGAMRGIVRLDRSDAAGVAAHYGSVSAVTFIVALATIEARGLVVEGVIAGLLAVLEVVGIVVGLALASRRSRDGSWSDAVAEVVRGRSIALLLLGLAVGVIAGDLRLEPVDPLFVGLLQGALVLFLIEMGAIAAERLRDVSQVGGRLVLAAILVPVVNGAGRRGPRFTRWPVDRWDRSARDPGGERVLHRSAGRGAGRAATGEPGALDLGVARRDLPVQPHHRDPAVPVVRDPVDLMT